MCIVNWKQPMEDLGSNPTSPIVDCSQSASPSTPSGLSLDLSQDHYDTIQEISSNMPPPSSEGTSKKTKKGSTSGRCTSEWWSYFYKVSIKKGDRFFAKAQCKSCKKQLGGDPRQGTSHLRKHYLCCPKRRNQDIRQQLLVSNAHKDGLDLMPCTFNQEFSHRELAKMIIMHEYPLSIVEHEGFREFCRSLNPLWSDVHSLMGVGAVLDPRFKITILECYFHEIYKDQAVIDHEIEKIHNVLRKLIDHYEENEHTQDEGQMSTTSTSVVEPSGAFSLNKFNLYASKKKRKPVKSELDLYLDEDTIPNSDDFDALVWWKANKGKFSILHKVARDILAIPVSTVASESAFSNSGMVISPQRSRLASNTVEVLMCTESWLLEEKKVCTTVLEDADVDKEA